jgi:hypothetical protein
MLRALGSAGKSPTLGCKSPEIIRVFEARGAEEARSFNPAAEPF